MIIQNLNNGKLLIRHETAVDPDNDFLHEETSEEAMLFDRFFKKALEDQKISVQVSEIIDASNPFSTYFAPCKIWEDTNAWKEWFKDFKDQHSMFLYFYEGGARTKRIFDGNVDTLYSTVATFNDDSYKYQQFVIDDYYLHENTVTSSFEIHINTDVIYDCLKKSEIIECRNLLKEFQYELLNKTMPVNVNTTRNTPKI
jgi:hypothetical protein